jgi:hypothetical protein
MACIPPASRCRFHNHIVSVLTTMTDQDSEADEKLISELQQDSDSLWSEQPTLATATLVGPVLVTAALLFSIAVSSGWEVSRRLVLAGFLTFFMLGRFVILGGTGDESAVTAFTSGELAVMVFYMDIMTAVILSFHAGFLFRIPGLGQRLRFLMDAGHEVLAENRWMRRATFASIVVFVMFPLASSGSVGGSLFGRLLGLSRVTTLLGVVVGSLLGCASMYYGATVINRFIAPDSLAIRWGGVFLIVALLAILNGRYRKAKQSL